MSLPPDMVAELAVHLDDIKKLFKNPKVTLVVRASQMPDGKGGLVMTDDDLDQVLGAIQWRQSEEPLA